MFYSDFYVNIFSINTKVKQRKDTEMTDKVERRMRYYQRNSDKHNETGQQAQLNR